MSLNYENVCLVPRQVSTINSRDEVDISTEFCGVKLEAPIIGAPMIDVCNGDSLKTLLDNGAFGFIPRFKSIEEQVKEFKIAGGGGCAIGINGDWKERFRELLRAGCDVFCIDVANGANTNVIETCEYLLSWSNVKVVLGNVASQETFNWCSNYAHAVRTGIAWGAGCSTYNATAVAHPMISLIDEVYKNREQKNTHIIADGGIREVGDIARALIFGADSVMLGSLIAACKDSPAKYYPSGTKEFRGSASFEIQELHKEPKYIEGKRVYLECKETITELLDRIKNGLKSSLAYMNAKNLQEYRKNLSYITI